MDGGRGGEGGEIRGVGVEVGGRGREEEEEEGEQEGEGDGGGDEGGWSSFLHGPYLETLGEWLSRTIWENRN